MITKRCMSTFLALAILAGLGIAACSDDSTSGGGTAGSAGTVGGDACVNACNKIENVCKSGTCTTSGTCQGKAKEYADCINSHTCEEKQTVCDPLLLGGTGGASGAGGGGVGGAGVGGAGVGGSAGGGGAACAELSGKCAGCTDAQMKTSCEALAAGGLDDACAAMLGNDSFQTLCP